MSYRNVAVLAVGLMVLAGCQAEETQRQVSEIAYEAIEASFVETDCPAADRVHGHRRASRYGGNA